MKKIFLVRHAETYANIGQVFDGQQFVKLTEKGLSDAKKLVRKIKDPKVIVVSKFFRTIETAMPTIEKYENAEIILLRHLHEFDYIDHEKFKVENIDRKKIIREYWDKYDPYYIDGKSLESFYQFTERLHKTILDLKKIESTGNVYVFSHGNFIKAFLLLNKEYPKFFKNKVKRTKKEVKSESEEFMKRFDVASQNGELEIKNCQIVEVTDIIKKY